MPTKNEKKKQEKIIEDKTFGLKNKNKSKAVQKYVKGVEQTVKNQGKSQSMLATEEFERKKIKKKQEEEKALLRALYSDMKNIRQAQQSEEQQDPATTLCPYFKQGLCQKGKKCIYSHDLTIGRTEQIDLYVDQRTQLIMNSIGGKELNQLSEEELTSLIGEKEKEYIKGARSQIMCKHFLEAVERGKYGWNWNCPNNGDKCKYKHCLPVGYKLKKDGQGDNVIENDQVSLEEKIDEERNKLSNNNSSPLVTYEVFMKWKEAKRLRREIEKENQAKEEEKKYKGKQPQKTGKELFSEAPNLFVDEEGAAAGYQKEEVAQEEEEKKERLYTDQESDGECIQEKPQKIQGKEQVQDTQ